MNQAYQIIKENNIGIGAYSRIYQCVDVSTKNSDLAVKVEPSHRSLLKNEYRILKYLQGGIGIPRNLSYFSFEKCNFLIMELLGENLKHYSSNHNLSKSALKNISLQMLNRIEFIHYKGIIHRDIKPENFVLGKDNNLRIVYLIDFGLAKQYCNTKTKAHIEYKERDHICGTLSYMSINSHLGVTVSRRDDLESFVYSIISLWKGGLPWDKAKEKDILNMKITYDEEKLCRGLHENFVKLLTYVKNLKFEENPDYNYIRKLLKGIPSDNSGEFVVN